MISKEKIQEVLRNHGITLESVKNPLILEKASILAYKAVPIPIRWFVGKKRVKKLVLSLAENISAKNRL